MYLQNHPFSYSEDIPSSLFDILFSTLIVSFSKISFDKEVIFTKKEKSFKLHSPSELLNLILKQGEKGLSLQRYKGLGEMNADQLWETTLDPDSRSLLQVKIEQSAEEGTTFSDLMGDDVEPRRIFIQEQALNVSNLDF